MTAPYLIEFDKAENGIQHTPLPFPIHTTWQIEAHGTVKKLGQVLLQGHTAGMRYTHRGITCRKCFVIFRSLLRLFPNLIVALLLYKQYINCTLHWLHSLSAKMYDNLNIPVFLSVCLLYVLCSGEISVSTQKNPAARLVLQFSLTLHLSPLAELAISAPGTHASCAQVFADAFLHTLPIPVEFCQVIKDQDSEESIPQNAPLVEPAKQRKL